MTGAEVTEPDWKAECRGLGWRILDIKEQYMEAHAHLGGNSEILASAVIQSAKYVDGPLRAMLDER
jgi:hypothetical protein